MTPWQACSTAVLLSYIFMWDLSPACNSYPRCGVQVDLTARLREILVNYPEGTSILKELVQVLHATAL